MVSVSCKDNIHNNNWYAYRVTHILKMNKNLIKSDK